MRSERHILHSEKSYLYSHLGNGGVLNDYNNVNPIDLGYLNGICNAFGQFKAILVRLAFIFGLAILEVAFLEVAALEVAVLEGSCFKG